MPVRRLRRCGFDASPQALEYRGFPGLGTDSPAGVPFGSQLPACAQDMDFAANGIFILGFVPLIAFARCAAPEPGGGPPRWETGDGAERAAGSAGRRRPEPALPDLPGPRRQRSASGRRPGSCSRGSGSGPTNSFHSRPSRVPRTTVRRSSGRTSSRVVGAGNIEARRARDLKRYHRRTAERRARGLCVKCGKQPPAPGRSQCEPCAEKKRPADRARHHRRTDERIARGLCPKCGKQPPAPELSVCEPCAEKKRIAGRARDAKLRAAGKPRRDRDIGRAYERQRRRRQAAERRAAGLCPNCGKHSPAGACASTWRAITRIHAPWSGQSRSRKSSKRSVGVERSCPKHLNHYFVKDTTLDADRHRGYPKCRAGYFEKAEVY